MRLGKTSIALARDLVAKSVFRNILSLYGAQFANYLLPLVTVPYLARVLGPDTWGTVLFVQAIGLYVVVIVNYSFDFSGTRDVAQSKDDPQALSDILSGVLGAKLVLVGFSVAGLAVAQILIPQLAESGWLLWLSVFWFASLGLQPLWYFLGIERLTPFLALNIGLRALAMVAIVVFVKSESDAWRVLAFQGTATALVLVVSMVWIYREIPFKLPSFSATWDSLRGGWKLFAFKTSESVFNMSNTVILGLFVSTNVVAYYAGADRLINVCIALLQIPITALYPRASSFARDNLPETARVARRTIRLLLPVALLGCILNFFLAPLTVRIIFGPGYEEVVPVLRILGVLLPVMAVLRPLGGHWAIPLGMDDMLTKMTLTAAALHIVLAFVLVSQFEHVGIAIAWVSTESYMLVVMTILLLRKKMHPFSARFSLPTEAPVAPAGRTQGSMVE